jgi:hypothetical protein
MTLVVLAYAKKYPVSISISFPIAISITLSLATLLLGGCASTPSAASLASSGTAVEKTDVREASNADRAPAGTLACRSRDAFGVVTNVYLEGETGTLQRLTPSGMTEEERLRFERSGGALIGDRATSEDLTVHAVTLRDADGKKYVRLGDSKQGWSACL